MFCNEPIKKVYRGRSEVYHAEDDRCYISNSFLDCFDELAYHVETGDSLVLETDNYAIFIEADGIKLKSAPAKPRSDEEWLDPCVETEMDIVPWIDLEQTLFEGEYLLEVKHKNGIHIIKFTDFELKVVPYSINTMNKGDSRSKCGTYKRILGCDRHLKRKCDCGGDGEIFLDFVDDYIVRCKSCKKSTWAAMNLICAIDDWNDGQLHCELPNIEIE